ncbi:MAG: DinB family protein [Gemmatirosa sp.]|nr:DinB family protein [Gemmatirosa sp.]
MPAAAAVLTSRPAEGEFNPYYGTYIAKVPDGDLLATLESQLEDTVALLDEFGESGAGTRYAPGKWSVKSVVGHLTDAERIFTYRALCAARGEAAELPGFDENAYVDVAAFDGRTLNSLMGELTAVRRATLSLFRNLGDDELTRRVSANRSPISARALAWIIAGHERHHAGLLRERYLPALRG